MEEKLLYETSQTTSRPELFKILSLFAVESIVSPAGITHSINYLLLRPSFSPF